MGKRIARWAILAGCALSEIAFLSVAVADPCPPPSTSESVTALASSTSDVVTHSDAPLDKLPVACVETAMSSSDNDSGKLHLSDKIRSMYAAANAYNMPPAVLTGAILQESGAVDEGIGKDDDNWTCGPGQFSVLAWCDWASHQDPSLQAEIHWPTSAINSYKASHPSVDVCGENTFLVRADVKPFEDIVARRLASQSPPVKNPEEQSTFITNPSPISYGQVAQEMTAISKAHQISSAGESAADQIRYAMTKSFAEGCYSHKYAYRVAAYTIMKIRQTLPKELQNAQTTKDLGPGGANNLYTCKGRVTSNGYPLQISWLVADAMYNAGPSLWTGIAAYQKKTGIPWENFSPNDLVKAIDYAITPAFGMWGIGPVEAKFHISGVVNAVTQDDASIVPER